MSKHTPGPWIVNAENLFGNGYKIASINDAGHNWQADRDLIAAAPDLLAALNTIAKIASEGRESDIDIESIARAAITKAEGGQP